MRSMGNGKIERRRSCLSRGIWQRVYMGKCVIEMVRNRAIIDHSLFYISEAPNQRVGILNTLHILQILFSFSNYYLVCRDDKIYGYLQRRTYNVKLHLYP